METDVKLMFTNGKIVEFVFFYDKMLLISIFTFVKHTLEIRLFEQL
jgi:hypothetical protein